MKIALTGADGLIGSRFFDLLSNSHELIPLKKNLFDITNAQQTRDTLLSTSYDILIHLAAYTNVDGAEKESETALSINVEGTRNVFNANKEKGGKLIYVSTDFVFDGEHPPYTEDSQPHPISVYGKSKYEGEQVVQGQSLIVRLSYPYRNEFLQKNDFVHAVLKQLKLGVPLQMVNDSIITPTFVDDIVLSIAQYCEHYIVDTVHIVGADSLSPYHAGLLIAEAFEQDPTLIKPISYAEYFHNKAARPRLSSMQSKKNVYPMKTFSEGLKMIV